MPSVICKVEDISFYNNIAQGIPTINRVGVKNIDSAYFLDPEENCKKPLFKAGQASYDAGNRIITLRASLGYFYTLAYALDKTANAHIQNLISDGKPEEKNDEDKGEPKAKDPKSVTDAVKKFKEDNLGNQKYYTEKYLVQPASYYINKLSEDIIRDSGFASLDIDDLMSISQVAQASKNGSADAIKATDNPWRSVRNYATKLGKHEETAIRLDALMKLGLIGQTEYDEQMELSDNPPARSYGPRGPRNTVEKKKFDKMTPKALECADTFNMLYCVNCINKDGLYCVD